MNLHLTGMPTIGKSGTDICRVITLFLTNSGHVVDVRPVSRTPIGTLL